LTDPKWFPFIAVATLWFRPILPNGWQNFKFPALIYCQADRTISSALCVLVQISFKRLAGVRSKFVESRLPWLKFKQGVDVMVLQRVNCRGRQIISPKLHVSYFVIGILLIFSEM
jgi:hypothetical protein